MGDYLPSWDPKWRRRYNSPPDDLIGDFYIPAFARSCSYDRAVGFFSSNLLAAIAPSIDKFVINGGQMRLVTSPANLSESELEAMGKGEAIKRRLKGGLEHAIAQSIPNPVLRDRLKLLTWMIAAGKLEVRIALREHPAYYSLFHEKIGVFSDKAENWMTFTGSPNETIAGARYHSESFPLHRSWASADQRAYAEEERGRFVDVWDGHVEGLTLWRVNEWIEEPMRSQFGIREPTHELIVPKSIGSLPPPIDEASPPVTLPPGEVSLLPSLPSELDLRAYQREAVNDWLRAKGRGTFAMATGTGKTLTALAAATQASTYAAQLNRPLLILVIVPLMDLVEQWNRAAQWFGFRPAVCHGKLNSLQQETLKTVFSAARATHGRRTEMVITTIGSLVPPSHLAEPYFGHFVQRQLSRHDGLLLVIGDEMHSMGTVSRLAALPKGPTFSLGLSATPKRHGDEVGTKALLDYFGEPIITISIKDAIYKHKALVPYDYIPSPISLTEDEANRYRVISQRIAAAYTTGDEHAADVHIRERTRLLQHAANKLVRLRQLLSEGLRAQTHQIFYVAEGKDPETEIRQLDRIEQLLRLEFGMRVERYYGETESNRREILQQRLATGEIQALLAMKCLDEGVDIPSVRIGVIMASTQNPRQFVQRRGRLLRHDPDHPKSHAIIHDFIVMPPRDPADLLDSEKTLIGAELSRAAELAEAARNRESLFAIIQWAYEYQLSPENYTWMSLSDEEDMEEWVS